MNIKHHFEVAKAVALEVDIDIIPINQFITRLSEMCEFTDISHQGTSHG